MTARRDVVAIGGSYGSGAVLRRLLGGLPPDFPAAVLITTHVPGHGPAYLAETLAGYSALPVSQAVDGAPIRPGYVIVAAPGRHMLAMDGTVVLGTGPRENMARPAIDPLFRSVALAYGPRAIGLVLTGLLNDGAAGLHAIKAMGGTAVVQHPLDAEADEMPRAALEAVEADAVGPAEELAAMLSAMAGTPAGQELTERRSAGPERSDLELEVAIAAGRRLGSDQLRALAEPSPLSCPHCHGVLSEMKGEGPLRYRCQIGHAFTAETIAAAGDSGVGDALRIAMRMMEERVELVSRMAREARASGRRAVAELYEARATEYADYAATLRRAATLDLRLARPGREQDI